MGGLAGVYLAAHTPRYCTKAAAFEGKLAHPDFRALRDGLVAQGRHLAGRKPHLAMMLGVLQEAGSAFTATVHAYGPSSGSGNYAISLASSDARIL